MRTARMLVALGLLLTACGGARSGRAASAHRALAAGTRIAPFFLPTALGDTVTLARGRPALVSFVSVGGSSAAASRAQVVGLESVARQHGERLQVLIVATADGTRDEVDASAAINAQYDWHLDPIPLAIQPPDQDLARTLAVGTVPSTFAISSDGVLVHAWRGYVGPTRLGRAVSDGSGPVPAALVASPRPAAAPAVAPESAVGTTYYVDCSAPANGVGTSTASPWNSVAAVNGHGEFSPGDRILFKRGTGIACTGMLAPQGSGNATDGPITLEGHTAGRTLTHIHITDVTVHDVAGDATNVQGGGIIVRPLGNDEKFVDVLIDGAAVSGTHQWSGIDVGANGDNTSNWNGANQVLNTDVIVRNSTVHDVWGSGITVFETDRARLQGNVAYNTGLMPGANYRKGMPTPNGILAWYCHNCITEFNESYDNHSPGQDGGAFDIDYYSANQKVQVNYGHDSDGYCVAVLGSGNYTTTNSVVRYNVCANNARRDSTVPTPLGGQFFTTGDVFLYAWGGGALRNVQVYNNTFYWNPAHDDNLLNQRVQIAGTNFFENNIVYATGANLMRARSSMPLDNNLYYTAATSPKWVVDSTTYTGFAAYTSGSGQDANGMFTDPQLVGVGSHAPGMPTSDYTLQPGSPAIDHGAVITGGSSHDFYGNPVGQGPAPDIGAYEAPH